MTAQKALTKHELATKAHANHEAILTMRHRLGVALLDLGRLLWENREHEYWRALSHETFEEYLASPEVCIRRSQAYKLIGVYETFRLQHKVPKEILATIGVEKLELIRVPVAGLDGERAGDGGMEQEHALVEEWLDRARRLARNDLKAEVRRLTGKEPETEEGKRRQDDVAMNAAIQAACVGGVVAEISYDRFEGLNVLVQGARGIARLKVWSPYGLRVAISFDPARVAS